MRDIVRVVQKMFRQVETSRAKSSGSNRFFQPGFLYSSKEGTIFVCISSKNLKQPSRRLKDEIERDSFSFSSKVAAKRVMELAAERDDLLLRLNLIKVSYEILVQ